MIAAIAGGLALTLAGGTLNKPVALAPKAACRLATKEKIPSEKAYYISGKYFADGMHGSEFELPGCDFTLNPQLDGAALARSSGYHSAFQTKCGGSLHGDYITGVFTGHFDRRPARLYGMLAPASVNFFVITDVETADEDPASITCPK